MDSVSHVRHVEVQKEPELVTGQFEIGQELGAMNRQYPLDAFELNDEATLDDEISPGMPWTVGYLRTRQADAPDVRIEDRLSSARSRSYASQVLSSTPALEGAVNPKGRSDDNVGCLIWSH